MRFIEYLIKKIKGNDFELDKDISLGYLLGNIISMVINLIRGNIKTFTSKKSSLLVFIGKRSKIKMNKKIKIGKGVNIGENVVIDALSKNGVTIGNNVRIGAGVVILDGVSIGDGCVIGANTLVNKDIPDNYIAVGNPVRLIKKRS